MGNGFIPKPFCFTFNSGSNLADRLDLNQNCLRGLNFWQKRYKSKPELKT